MKGTAKVGTLPDANVDADDIFSHFKRGALLYFEAAKDRWTISSDIF